MTGFEPEQTPDWQVSVCVQAFPSTQTVPLLFGGFVHTPELVSHAPTRWHWSEAVQVFGFEPVQAPPWHVSVWVQALPSTQAVPLSFGGFVHTPELVSHVPTA